MESHAFWKAESSQEINSSIHLEVKLDSRHSFGSGPMVLRTGGARPPVFDDQVQLLGHLGEFRIKLYVQLIWLKYIVLNKEIG